MRIYNLKVANKGPALRKLRIFQPFAFQANKAAFETFKNTLEQLLQACHQTLEMISIESVYSLSQLPLPLLENLRKLKLKTKFGPLESFSRTLLSIDYGRSMPGLEEVVIKMDNIVELDSGAMKFFFGGVA